MDFRPVSHLLLAYFAYSFSQLHKLGPTLGPGGAKHHRQRQDATSLTLQQLPRFYPALKSQSVPYGETDGTEHHRTPTSTNSFGTPVGDMSPDAGYYS